MPTVVVVDDEEDMRFLVGMALRRHGFEVVAEAADGVDGFDAVTQLDESMPDVLVLDNRMPGRTGVELAAEIRRLRPALPIVLFSAFLDRDTEARAMEAGVTRCVSKDRIQQLGQVLDEVLAAA